MLNSIQTFKKRDIAIYDKSNKKLRRQDSIDEKSCSESLQNKSLKDLNDSSDSSEEEKEEVSNTDPRERLFIGTININKCEENARNLYNKLLTDGDKLKTDFWANANPVNVKRVFIRLLDNIEELRETQKMLNEVDNEFDLFNKIIPRCQYLKHHKAQAKWFLENVGFINRQLSIYDASQKCVSSFLGIEEKQLAKLLKYYLKPRERSVKIFLISR